RVLRHGIAIASALADVHGRGVVHKDIKPKNILVDRASGAVELCDFGIATLLPVEHREALPPTLIEGTLAYMSPEQTGRMNRGLDHRSDLYSLGITLYRMLSGRLPFHGRDPLEWCHCHLAQQPRPPVAPHGEVPPVLSRIVLKLMAKEP